MAYGIEVKNSDGIKIITDQETSYYVYEEGTLSPDASGTTVTNFSKVSSLNYAYYLSDFFLHNFNSTVGTWNSSTNYSFGDLVIMSGTAGAGSLIYECTQANSNFTPATNPRYWRKKYIRNSYNRVNSAIFSEMENKNALIFFKLPSVSDKIMTHYPSTKRDFLVSSQASDIAFEAPTITNLSSLDYAIIRPLTDFTPTTGGYGMEIYNASGDVIHVTNEKIAHIDNFGNEISQNSSITSSGSSIDWVCLPPQSRTYCQKDFNTNSSGTRYTNYITRDTSTNWKNEFFTYSAGTQTYGNTILGTNFLIGRMD